ncbi:MAG: hypothetical protein KKF50_04810 [Nanoarchaeota archaeon]|nr:hypothetical protein [Nanoarchaeota archaeon]
MGKTDPIKRAHELRENLIWENELMVVDFSDTLQGKDTSRVIDTMPNVATGEYVFRAKVNVKELDKMASAEYGKEFFDVTQHTNTEIEAFTRKQEFDFPLWYKHQPDFKMKNILDYNPPFIFQVAGCNFHDGSIGGGCSYCFVDNKSNDGVVSPGKAFLTGHDTIESMLSAREKIKTAYKEAGQDMHIRVLRASGGEPTLALDWILDMWREIGNRGLDFVGQIDSNLSTGMLVDEFERTGVYEPHTLEKLAEFPIKILTAIKGVDPHNLQENVQSYTDIAIQEHSIKKFLNAGFDIFPQMYNPDPATLRPYLEHMDDVIENFSQRIHIGPLKAYGPTIARIGESEIEAKKEEWDSNYKNGCEILDTHLRKRYGVGYKEVTRSDVPLKILKK